ncbi:DUF4238 domain-containing protein [Tahibacter caeni]|uniref:DUF4238 domain-containing protein n=1 Tax=Tahibacter caeni TaxID=1453545 RepID=UPI0021473E28|nr:DUF4238 domain-containing protein [Tahibacter caeni]
MGKANVTKRCHWVPQAYLRGFASDDEKKKIWRFGRTSGDPELKGIDKVAVRFHLYVPKDADGQRDDSFEHKLADLEQWFGSVVWKKLRDDMIDLSWDPLRKMVSLLAATLMLRNPAFLQLTQEMHAQLVDFHSGPGGPASSVEINGKEYELDLEKWPAYRDAGEDDIKRFWIEEISGAGVYAKMFMAMRWSMVIADQPVFITSDNPITFLHPSDRFRGIKNSETSILFPISPARLLLFDNRTSEPANQYYPLKGNGGAHNLLIWRNANEHMFSHRNPDEVCAEMLKASEEFGSS